MSRRVPGAITGTGSAGTGSAGTGSAGTGPGSAVPRLVTRPLLVRFVSVAGVSASFYLLLSSVPLYARATGASAGLAGLTTSALTLATVASYLVAPRLMTRYGCRALLAGGLLALGAPALLLAVSANIALIMAVCVIRGAGFALTCVAGGSLTVSLLPPRRRGEGLALIGLVSGVPSVAALPLGVWLAGHAGYRPGFVAGGLAALAGLASVPWLPRSAGQSPGSGGQSPRSAGQSPGSGGQSPGSVDRAAGWWGLGEPAERPAGIVATVSNPALLWPAVTFSATTMAVGIIVTYLPLAAQAHATAGPDIAALALFSEPAAAIGGRWLAGRYGDRRGSARLLGPGVLIAAAGMLALSLAAIPAVMLAGATLFGLGFGVTQNASQTLMYDRVPESGYGVVSAVWNLAYDGGMGLGAAGFGVLVAHTGYPAAFALAAATLPLILVAAGRGRTAAGLSRRGPGNRGQDGADPSRRGRDRGRHPPSGEADTKDRSV
jgi:predicted MFS family arabinose efflux permease